MENKEVEQQPKEVAVKQEDSLVQKLGETVDILKKKIAALQERNMALLAKTKEQAVALSAKPVAAGKSVYETVKGWVSRKPRVRPEVLVRLTSGTVIRGKLDKMDDDFLTVQEVVYDKEIDPKFAMKSYKIAVKTIELIGEK